MNRARTEFTLALLLDLLGAAGVLLISTRVWQTVRTPRPRPLADDVLDLSGRTLDATPVALALVALAGVVAVLATRGLARRAIGAALLLTGLGVIWTSADGLREISADRAIEFVESKHSGVGIDLALPQVSVHAGWAWLSLACGALIAVAGLLIALRGHTWSGMSARYEPPQGGDSSEAERRQQQAEASLWQALDRGDDPTAGPSTSRT